MATKSKKSSTSTTSKKQLYVKVQGKTGVSFRKVKATVSKKRKTK